VQGEDGYESFDIFFELMFGGGPRYDLAVRGADGRRRMARVEGITLAQRRAQRRAQRGATIDQSVDTPHWTIARRGGSAILTMPGWGLYNSKWDWTAWIDDAVDRLIAKQVPKLVVDLRGNEGRMDCGDVLVARFARQAIVSDDARRLVRYRTITGDLRPHLDTWDRAFDDWSAEATPHDARFLQLTGPECGATVIQPKGARYKGKVVVLTGAQNSSATFQFVRMVQRERLGTLIGGTTGGNRRGINGGAFYFLRLPETGTEVDLPLIGTFARTAQPDAGVVPDVIVPMTAQAIARGADPAMAQALRFTRT
jgi:C-terminal processing protease CtpA/Prc